jgi:hypothetical protein
VDSKEEYKKLIHRIQDHKMKELWDDEEDTAWDSI